jgi:pimeloyl-ACP methyl ester carboxylesterase
VIRTVALRHARMQLALHELRPDTATGHPLLLLHGLGERSPSEVPAEFIAWPGAVWALDFGGHGASSVSTGGGYTCELLMADADAALASIGPCTVHGRGIGGYVGLLLAGARASQVRGVIIDDGTGLRGGGESPGSATIAGTGRGMLWSGATPDPFALAELSTDVRPPDYAQRFVRLAVEGSTLEIPVAIVAAFRPPWLAALVGEYGVTETVLTDALRLYA